MKTKQTFDSAFAQLTTLVNNIENSDIKIDTLAEKIKEANELIVFCETALRSVQEETTLLK